MFGKKEPRKSSVKGPADKAKPEPDKQDKPSKLSKVPLLKKLGKSDNGQKHDTNVPEYCIPNPDGFGPGQNNKNQHTNPKLPNIISATSIFDSKTSKTDIAIKDLTAL